MTARPFDKWPPLNFNYEGYQDGRGETLTEAQVFAAFEAKHGKLPAQVLWCKPGVWLAGPVVMNDPTLPDGFIELVTVEDLPAPEMAMVASEEQTEAAPVLEGQARLL